MKLPMRNAGGSIVSSSRNIISFENSIISSSNSKMNNSSISSCETKVVLVVKLVVVLGEVVLVVVLCRSSSRGCTFKTLDKGGRWRGSHFLIFSNWGMGG